MRPRIFQPKWMKPFHDIHKHMDTGEKWIQYYPEKKYTQHTKMMTDWDGSFGKWNNNFQKGIADFEKMMDEFEKKMDDS
ncbi:hypothetical protein [Pontibacillus halophilus]|uniref:hypothetical protein n=1 Tax=Pontibacillus halophilus TaxID=516704 RepID=UPI001E3C4C10|nr:hypothetical protein [Pontibacillus halophilus]